MITKINDMDLRILSEYTKGYDKEYYIREIEKITGISSRTALITLAKLEEKGILESKTMGKIKTYKIRKTITSREYFILTEQYKKIRFMENNLLIKEIIEKTENYVQGMIILFGSYVKQTQKEGSDLDMFIVGKYNEEKIKETGRTYGVEVNIKSYPKKLFEKEINQDILLKEIAENHILIQNAERYVRKITEWTR